MSSVWRKSLFERRRSLMWWSIGLLLFVLMTVSLYPTVRDSPGMDDLLDELPAAFKAFVGERSFTSPLGYLQGRLFQLMAPLLFMIFAIGRGADAIAGEEQRHTMELLLAHPISRARVLLEKFAAMTIEMLVLGAVLSGSLVLLAPVFGLDLSFDHYLSATACVILLALAFGALALFIGSATGRKGLAVGVSSAVATATYVFESIATVATDVDRYAWISPFDHYFDADALASTFPVVFMISYLGAIALMVVTAVWSFERRDVLA
jgi:ABC-2 type transport system permease protein